MDGKILIIEDGVTIAGLLKIYLNSLGFSIDSAYDGEEGQKKCMDVSDYSLVLLDIRLPKISGLSILKMIRGELNCPDVPVILMSGDPFDTDELKSLGADAFLRKPFELSELGKCINRLLERDKSRVE